MLITKEIKIHNKKINIKDLPINSHKKVEAKCDNWCIEKEIFSKKLHNYIMILNKDYTEFEKIIKKC